MLFNLAFLFVAGVYSAPTSTQNTGNVPLLTKGTEEYLDAYYQHLIAKVDIVDPFYPPNFISKENELSCRGVTKWYTRHMLKDITSKTIDHTYVELLTYPNTLPNEVELKFEQKDMDSKATTEGWSISATFAGKVGREQPGVSRRNSEASLELSATYSKSWTTTIGKEVTTGAAPKCPGNSECIMQKWAFFGTFKGKCKPVAFATKLGREHQACRVKDDCPAMASTFCQDNNPSECSVDVTMRRPDGRPITAVVMLYQTMPDIPANRLGGRSSGTYGDRPWDIKIIQSS